MDPNTTGQPTPDSTPPAAPGWGTPPPAAPTAPGWGTPPPAAPTDPGWAAPPAWASAPPAASGSGSVVGKIAGSVAGRIIAAVVVLAIIGIAGFVYTTVANPDHLGQVQYTTTDQSDSTTCQLSDVVTSVKAGTPVWSLYQFKHRLSSTDAVFEQDYFNGQPLSTYDWPADKTAGLDCLAVTNDLSTEFTTPGTYEIKLTVGSDVVADGKLTVTP
jgi:hypothetical protein